MGVAFVPGEHPVTGRASGKSGCWGSPLVTPVSLNWPQLLSRTAAREASGGVEVPLGILPVGPWALRKLVTGPNACYPCSRQVAMKT